VRTATYDWACNSCGATEMTATSHRPSGWTEAEVVIDGVRSHWLHFCSEDCLNEWKEKAGL